MSENPPNKTPLLKPLLTLALALLVLGGLYLARLYSYLLFHSLLEMFTVVVACGIFIIAWNTRRLCDNNYLLFLGISFLFVGILVLIHTLAYRGMGVFVGWNEANLSVQLWTAGRYLLSLSMLAAPLFLSRRMSPVRVTAVYAALTAFLLATIFWWRIFPDCFVDEPGRGLTAFKKISEYLVSLVFTAALGLLIANRERFDRTVLGFLIGAIAASIAAELCFTLYTDVYDRLNVAGHYLVLISFALSYKAIIETSLARPYNLLFRELKQSEEGLRTAVNFERQILSTAATAIFTVDPQRRATSVNEEFCRLTGFREDEIVGRSCELFCNCAREQTCHLFTADHRPPLRKEECLIRRKDGGYLTVIKNADLISGESGAVTGGIESFVDVTALVEARQAAEAASRAKSAFLANMSHELRTPLTAVLGFARLLQDEAPGPLNADQKENVASIVRSGEHLQSLISDILDLARIETGKLHVNVRPLELAPQVEWSLMVVREKAGAHQITLLTRVPDDLPPVAGDERAVRQVLVNLLNNAVKFTPNGGRVEVNAFPYGEFVAVEVVDTGIGIAPEDFDRIFGVFERASGTKSRAIEGTGLGLPLVRGLLAAMGGAITVESEVGKGSRFTFTLPVAGGETSVPGPHDAAARAPGSPAAPRAE